MSEQSNLPALSKQISELVLANAQEPANLYEMMTAPDPEVLEPAYGFASLFRFKGKFRPRYRELTLAYRDPLHLPAIGAAVGRAYLPDASRREILALARSAWGGRR